jgi:hypothetical protein
MRSCPQNNVASRSFNARDVTDPGEERTGRFDPADASPEGRNAECFMRPGAAARGP